MHITELLSRPLHVFVSGAEEIDWRFLLIGSLVAAVVLGDGRIVAGLRLVWCQLDLPRKLRTKSGLLDVRYFILNATAYTYLASATTRHLPDVSGAGRRVAELATFGRDEATINTSVARVGFTLCVFLLVDLSFYGTHRMMHAVPVLWAFHKVHHSTTELNPLSSYRNHPVQAVVVLVPAVLVASFFRGAFGQLGGHPIRPVSFLAINAGIATVFALGAFLRHSTVWVTFRGPLRWILHTPAHHQIHHSGDPADFNSNYSGVLILWDRIFGTASSPLDRQAPSSIGLGDAAEQERLSTLRGLLFAPFGEVFVRLRMAVLR